MRSAHGRSLCPSMTGSDAWIDRACCVWSVIVEPGFDGDAESVGDPIYIREVGRHFGDVEDVPIGESGGAESVDIVGVDIGWSASEPFGVAQQRSPPCVEAGRSPIALDRDEKFVVLEKPPQTAPVVGQSVVAFVD